jgi:hypothetical protein
MLTQYPATQIDRENGAVNLPNGLEIGPALTQDEFRALPYSHHARSQDHGTLPWIHYQLSGGHIDGKELLASLCFYDQLLVELSVTADLYPPGPKDCSRYSLEVEAATKQFHDSLLDQLLGRPSKGAGVLVYCLPEEQKTLEQPLRWDFPWGSVYSYHDPKGGATYITVGYRNRKIEASGASGGGRRPANPPMQ